MYELAVEDRGGSLRAIEAERVADGANGRLGRRRVERDLATCRSRPT
jgi:hypothetical protein